MLFGKPAPGHSNAARILLAFPLLLLLPALFTGCATNPDAVNHGPSAATLSQEATDLQRRPLGTAEIDSLRRDIDAVMEALRANREGEIYAGAVGGVDPGDLAIAVALVDGRSLVAGDADVRFPLMSVSKPFTYALALEQRGAGFMLETIGVSATGLPYNSVTAGAVRATSEQNPMVNAGAIATHSHILGADSSAKIGAVIDLYSRMANRPLAIEEAWRATPRALTYALAYQMQAVDRLEGDVEEVASRYLESNIVAVRVGDLAQMGATLASGGVQPLSGERILARETVRIVLSAMVIAGMYEDSGNWWTRVGVPAKSGVSGAIVAVVPGWGAIVAYSPRLDAAGNSVRASLAIEQLAQRWRLHSIDRLLDSRDRAGG
jgi:glutaminase